MVEQEERDAAVVSGLLGLLVQCAHADGGGGGNVARVRALQGLRFFSVFEGVRETALRDGVVPPIVSALDVANGSLALVTNACACCAALVVVRPIVGLVCLLFLFRLSPACLCSSVSLFSFFRFFLPTPP